MVRYVTKGVKVDILIAGTDEKVLERENSSDRSDRYIRWAGIMDRDLFEVA